MLIAQRGQPERAVGLRVLVIADADQALLEQLHDGCEHLLARQPWPGHVGRRSRSNHRQDRRKCLETIELVAVAARAPLDVIPVLLSSACITSCGLHMSLRIRTDPHILPRGRNSERANASEIGGTADRPAVGARVPEPERAHLAPDAGTIVGDVAESGGCGRCKRGRNRFAPFLTDGLSHPITGRSRSANRWQHPSRPAPPWRSHRHESSRPRGAPRP